MDATQLITDIIDILYAGVTGVAGSLGKGLSELVQGMIYTTSGSGESATTSMSAFFTVVLIFAGISLALGLGRWILNFITSLGNKNS